MSCQEKSFKDKKTGEEKTYIQAVVLDDEGYRFNLTVPMDSADCVPLLRMRDARIKGEAEISISLDNRNMPKLRLLSFEE